MQQMIEILRAGNENRTANVSMHQVASKKVSAKHEETYWKAAVLTQSGHIFRGLITQCSCSTLIKHGCSSRYPSVKLTSGLLKSGVLDRKRQVVWGPATMGR